MARQRLVIANTTPLINFAEIDRLELLLTDLQTRARFWLSPRLVGEVLRDAGE